MLLAGTGIGVGALTLCSPGSSLDAIALPLAAGYLALAVLAWRHGSGHTALWSWMAWPLTIAGAVSGVLATTLIGDLVDVDLWSAVDLTAVQAVAATVGFWSLSAVPSVVGVVLGIRAARTGSRSGLVASLVNGLTLMAVVILVVADLTSLPL